jgi:murein L,D-transpeptidase YafK
MGTAPKITVLTLVLALLAVWPSRLHSSYTELPEIKGPTEMADRVLVLKSRRLLFLLNRERTIKKYRIALGDNPEGHKLREGDERTPEGNYYLDWRNPDSRFHKSIHISYPDENDIARSEELGVPPGGNIMIHGVAEGVRWMGAFHWMFDWTDGCIAVTNTEMDEIWGLVEDGTPIEIRYR